MKYIICEHCGEKVVISEAEIEKFDTIECPICESDTYIGDVYDTKDDLIDNELDFNDE